MIIPLNKYIHFFMWLSVIFYFLVTGCATEKQRPSVSDAMDFAALQTRNMLDSLAIKGTDRLPKSVNPTGELVSSGIYDWTSGFFPGSLWYLYKYSDDPFWEEQARRYTQLLVPVKDFSGHHDVGFMIGSSFGNGYRFTKDSAYREVIIQAAKSLSKRYNAHVGAILSWNVDKGWQSQRGWKFPVIIDNMMNLELLFEATTLTGDSTFYRIAVSHADVTLANHFRPDYSSFHVVDYSPDDGSVLHRQTAQGYADSSAWARGQAWALYGFIMCYENTGFEKYRDHAQHVADFIINHPRLPADKVPYWDFDSPDIPNTYRDASAGAIIASALLKLADVVDQATSDRYWKTATTIIETLSSPQYRADAGSNQGFILKHSVGSIPHNNEIDVPLAYADYYYLEALLRLSELL